MPKLLRHLLLICVLVLAIAAGNALAIPTPTDSVEPVYVQPYAFSRCLTKIPPMARDRGVVIQDEQTLQSRWLSSPNCKTDKQNTVAFSRDMLLGRAFEIPGGCSNGRNGFSLSVTQNKRRRVYTHTITHGIGPCAGNSIHEIWVVVPKLPSVYTVEFQKIQQQGLIVSCGYEEEDW